MKIMVIFPRGDRSRLAFAEIPENEESDYSLAGRQSFPVTPEGKADAKMYGRDLARKHGLPIDYSDLEEDGQSYLD